METSRECRFLFRLPKHPAKQGWMKGETLQLSKDLPSICECLGCEAIRRRDKCYEWHRTKSIIVAICRYCSHASYNGFVIPQMTASCSVALEDFRDQLNRQDPQRDMHQTASCNGAYYSGYRTQSLERRLGATCFEEQSFITFCSLYFHRYGK